MDTHGTMIAESKVEVEPIIYTDDKQPDFEGPFGKAWLQDVESFKKRHPTQIMECSLDAYLIYAPSYHFVWHSYAVVCVSLKDVPGTHPAKINLEGATHEIFVVALNPDFKVPLNDYIHQLLPINFTAQFIAENDEQANERVKAAVMEILNGTLSPDTDYMYRWIERFGNSNFIGRG